MKKPVEMKKMRNEGFLYDSEKIKITYFKDSFEEHSLIVGGVHFLLQRGVLEELARTPIIELRRKLSAIISDINHFTTAEEKPTGRDIDHVALKSSVYYHELDFALKQARIKDLENQISGLAKELFDSK